MSSPDVAALHARAEEAWLDVVRAVDDGQLAAPTPCTEWDVRALLNHVVGEDRWTAPLMAGQTIEQVGDRFDGDLLGHDFRTAAEQAAKEAVASLSEPGAGGRTVHLSFGDTPAEEEAWQLTADHLLPGWDLAAATGQDRALDDELVRAVAQWYAEREIFYRQGGAVADRPDAGAATAQDQLLVAVGRDPDWRH